MTTVLANKPQFVDLSLTYDAKSVRQPFADLIGTDGVVAINDWLCVPKGGSAGSPDAGGGSRNRSVDILSPAGAAAWILGDDTPATQGIYRYLSDGTSPINETLTANSSGSTRIDVVILEIVPGSNQARTRIVQGTPGAGQPATPNNALALAAVTCADSYTQITSTEVADLRTWASRSTIIAVPSGAVTLSASAWTDICSATIVLSRDRAVEIVGWAGLVNSGAGRAEVSLQIVDGATHLFGIGRTHMGGSGDNYGDEISLATPRRCVRLAAGSHTLKLQGYKDANGTINANKSQTLASQAIAVSGLEVTL